MNKIDMVYLWCDGNDPKFVARKNELLTGKERKRTAGAVRFWDNEELRYSLRSLEKYAPWINHVYIITDRQVPYWLDTSYEKVTVVDHSEIMPKECIPCFNSNVIEYFLPCVPGLNEQFLYGNDDMFFCGPVKPEDFFIDGKPVIRLTEYSKMEKFWGAVDSFLGSCGIEKYKNYSRVPSNMVATLRLLEKEYAKVEMMHIHHNIDAYSKKSYLNTLKKFEDSFKSTNQHHFRNDECIHRIIFALDCIYSGNAILKIEPNFEGLSKIFVGLQRGEIFSYFGKEHHIDRIRKVMKRNKPKLFCLNAEVSGSQAVKEKAQKFMKELFPQPSRFEKI